MALCEHCGQPLTCADHGAPKSDGLNLVQQCPKKVAVWILVKDDAGTGLQGFEVKCAGVTKKTNKTGYAYFENLDPAKYTAEINVPEPAAGKPRLYKKLEQTSQSDDVKQGEVKLFRFELIRFAFLKVKVVRADDEKVFIPDVKVDVETVPGAAKQPQQTSDNAKPVPYDSIEAADYKVTLSFAADTDKQKYRDLEDGWSQAVTLAHGDTKEVLFKLEPVVRVYLTLKFNDPDAPTDAGKARPFPPDFALTVVSSGENKIEAIVGKDGMVRDKKHPEDKPYVEVSRSWKWVALDLPTDKKRWVVCEKRGAAAAPPELIEDEDPYSKDTPLSTRIVKGQRVFMLPAGGKWNLKNADWKVEAGGAAPDNYKEFQFKELDNEAKGVGTEGQRVEALLDMHWQYLRFEYYDRFYYKEKWGEKPITVLQTMMEGYAAQQKEKEMDALTAARDKLTTVSNWDLGTKDIELVQCLPWIIRRKDDDNSELKKPDKESTLRFVTDKLKRFIKSDKQSRQYVEVDKDKDYAPKGAVKVDVERLRYYDLPEEWRSTCYFCRLSDTAADQDFFEMLVEKATTKEKPLIFSLDDMVLTDENLKPINWRYEKPEVATNPNDRVAIFSHKFAGPDWTGGKTAPTLLPKEKRETWVPPKPQVRTDRAQPELSPDGLYLHESGSDHGYISAVCMPTNYIADYANWTRLVIAQGNVHDVFDKRTTAKDRSDKTQPVGARAAVRWIESASAVNAAGLHPASRPDMTRYPSAGTGADADAEKLFATQPLFEQEFMDREVKVDSSSGDGIGRCDPVLLRCCDRDGETELAEMFVYSRVAYNFASPPGNGLTEDQYGDKQAKNVANRWNGRDANGAKTELSPKDAKIKLKVKVNYFIQVVPKARGHIEFKLVAGDDRSFVSSWDGVGELHQNDYQPTGEHGDPQTFTACHEWGHFTAQPDDYGERWENASYDRLDYTHNLAGLPFEDDKWALMRSNLRLRGRNFWFLAEWARKACGVEFKLKHGADEDYWLPPHPSAPTRTYSGWPYAAVADGSVGGRSKFDVVLYGLGNDKTANDVYPNLFGGGAKFDGIAVINLRLAFSFWFTTHAAIRNVLAQLDNSLRQAFNNKFYAVGKVSVGGKDQELKRCAIVLQPRYLVSTFSGGAHWKKDDGTPMTEADYMAVASRMTSNCGEPQTIFALVSPDDIPATEATPPDGWADPTENFYLIVNKNTAVNDIVNVMRPHALVAFRELLGLPAGTGDIPPASVAPVIKKVLPNASVWKIA